MFYDRKMCPKVTGWCGEWNEDRKCPSGCIDYASGPSECKPPYEGGIMSSSIETAMISVESFRNSVLFMLDETFDNVQGAYLDPGDSLFTTLEQVTAEQASIPICGEGNSIASQVNHVIFYFDVGFQYMRGENPGRQDWGKAWETVRVTDAEWDALKQQLRERQQTLVQLIRETPDEAFRDNEEMVGGAMATIAHTAFHLGQIRHALCMIEKSTG